MKLYDTAIKYFNKGSYGQSIELFQEIIEKDPGGKGLYPLLSRSFYSRACFHQGISFFGMGKFSRAAEDFCNALKFDQKNVEILEYLGICYQDHGDFQKAVQTFNKILEIDPTHLSSKLKLANALHKLRIWDKAISTYRDILKIYPSYADTHFHIGLAFLGQGKADEALLAFQNALKINPNFAEARIKLGITHAYLGNFDDALSYLSSALKDFPLYADLHYFLGIVHASLPHPDIEKSVDCFKQALQINPFLKEAKVKIGIILCRKRNFKEGLKELEDAHRLDPKNKILEMIIRHLKTLGVSYEIQDEEKPEFLEWFFDEKVSIGQVIRVFIKEKGIDPNISDMLSIVRSFPDGNALLHKIIPIIIKTVKQHPVFPDLHYSLGILYDKIQKFEDAEASFKEAIRINPNYNHAHMSLFNTLKKQGKSKAALKEGDYLFEKNIPYLDFYSSLGEFYISQKMFNKARDVLQKALDKNPDYAPAKSLMTELSNIKCSKGI